MTGIGGKVPAARARAARDLRTVAVAVCFLALSGGVWMWLSGSAAQRREKVLASVPAFPARGQEQPSRHASAPRTSPPVAPRRVDPAPADKPVGPAREDAITSFVLKPAHNVALVHVNALLNTPLFDRIRQCMPAEWGKLMENAARIGIDLERDVDRLAVTADGMAMSGFFDGKPIARNIAGSWPDREQREYRGQTIWLSHGVGIAQVGNLLVLGPPDSMDKLLDRVLDPAPQGTDPQDIYGDVFMRTDLSDLRDSAGGGVPPDALGAVLDGLSNVTVRANVWDMVALSVEGKPHAGRSVHDLAGMARGMISLASEQLDPNDVELATLAELAKVTSSTEALNIDLALPVNDVFDKLHFPCPSAAASRQRRDEVGPVSRDSR
jgi:hypothetical protein